MRTFRILTTLLTMFLIATNAFAKKVTIEWKPIKSASMYEILVAKDGTKVAQKMLADSSWTGELDFGLYSFQIRAIDIIKRAGKWSEPRPLVVMPKAPEVISPKGRIALYDPNATIALKWTEVVGIKKYKVEVMRGKTTVYNTVVEGTALDIKSQGVGEYSWRVTAVIDSPNDGRMPASFGGKSWESKPSDNEDFEIEGKQLGNVVPVEPLGQILPPQDGKVRFRWKSVDGAEGYEITLIPVKVRSPASGTAEKTFVVKEDEAILDVSGEGQYKWVSRAIANVDSKGAAGAVGPKTTAAFELNRNAKFFEGTGYIAISTLLSSYNYKSVVPGTSTSASGIKTTTDKGVSTTSQALSFRLSGEYFPHPQWGIGAAIENTSLQMAGALYQRKTYEVTGRYRTKLGNDKYGWYFYPKFGLEARDYFALQATSTSTTVTTTAFSTFTYGPSTGFDLRKQISERWSLGLKTGYWLPVGISGDAEGLSGSENSRNINVGLQGVYWANKNILIGMGAYRDNRSISYKRAGNTESVNMDATYFFGSLIYTFGN